MPVLYNGLASKRISLDALQSLDRVVENALAVALQPPPYAGRGC